MVLFDKSRQRSSIICSADTLALLDLAKIRRLVRGVTLDFRPDRFAVPYLVGFDKKLVTTVFDRLILDEISRCDLFFLDSSRIVFFSESVRVVPFGISKFSVH